MYLSLLGARTIDLMKGLQPNWAVQLCRSSCQKGEGEERGQISNQEKEKISWILMLLKGQKRNRVAKDTEPPRWEAGQKTPLKWDFTSVRI